MKRAKSKPQFSIDRLRLFRDVAVAARSTPRKSVAKVLAEKKLNKSTYGREVGALEDIVGVYFLQRVVRNPALKKDGEQRINHPLQAKALQDELRAECGETLALTEENKVRAKLEETTQKTLRKFGREPNEEEVDSIRNNARRSSAISMRSKSDLTPAGEAWADFAEIVVSLYDITLAATRTYTQANDFKLLGSDQRGVLFRKGRVTYPNDTDIGRYREWLAHYRDEVRRANEMLAAGDRGPEHLVQLLRARDTEYDDNGNLNEWARPA